MQGAIVMTPAKNSQRGLHMGFMRFASVATLALLASTQVQAKEWTTVRIGTEAHTLHLLTPLLMET